MSKNTIFSIALFLLITVGATAQNPSLNKQINLSAPVKGSKTVFIKASPEKVWAVLSDIDQWSTWLSSVKYSKLTDTLLPGHTYDMKAGGMNFHCKLHTVEVHRALGWTGKVYGIAGIHNYTIKQVEGGTEVTDSESMDGFLAHLFKKSFNKTIDKDLSTTLEQLKKACEQ